MSYAMTEIVSECNFICFVRSRAVEAEGEVVGEEEGVGEDEEDLDVEEILGVEDRVETMSTLVKGWIRVLEIKEEGGRRVEIVVPRLRTWIIKKQDDLD